MSLIDRISELNRLDNQFLIQNDRIGRNAQQPDQTVRKMMTPLENEMISEYEQVFPNHFDNYTGKVDANGNPVKTTKLYEMPGFDPEYLSEPDPIDDKEMLKQEKELREEMSYIADNLAQLNDSKRQIHDFYNECNNEYNEGTMSKNEFEDNMKVINETIQRITTETSGSEAAYNVCRSKAENLKQIVENYNAEVLKIKNTNKMTRDEYNRNVRVFREGAFNTEPNIGEDEASYLQRMRDNAEILEPDDELISAKSLIYNNFKASMKQLFADESKIEQVANGIDPLDKVDNKYKILKHWTLFKNKFLMSYGANNKRVTANDVLTFANSFLKFEKDRMLSAVNNNLKSSGRHIDGITFETNTETKTLLIHNTQSPNILFLRVIRIQGGNSRLKLLFSTTGKVGSFIQFFDEKPKTKLPTGRTENSSDIIERETGITKENLKQLFDISTGDVDPAMICQKLTKEPFKLPQISSNDPAVIETQIYRKSGTADGKEYGMGLHGSEEIPRYAPFGTVYILLKKLFYENKLSIRNPQMKIFAGFRTIKVSEQFVKLIMNMMKGINPTNSDLNMLKTGERQVYDRLITLAHLNKEIPHQKDSTVKEIKKRLQLLEAEIQIGNNSPIIKKEIYGILHTLKDFKCITQSQINSYLKQI